MKVLKVLGECDVGVAALLGEVRVLWEFIAIIPSLIYITCCGNPKAAQH